MKRSLGMWMLLPTACAITAQEVSDKAERYRQMLAKRPENAVLYGRLLDAWLEERELAGLREWLEDHARNGQAADWRILAVFYEQSGEEQKALEALNQAVQLAPEEASGRLARAAALGRALDFDAALHDLEIAAQEETLAQEAMTLQGRYLARAGRPNEAVAAWQKLIERQPEDDGLKEDFIALLVGEGLLEEAVAMARNLMEQEQDAYRRALRRLELADLLGRSGKKDEAIQEYKELLRSAAERSWLERESIAKSKQLFAREHDRSGLESFLKELLEEHPRRVALRLETARMAAEGGDMEAAIRHFREMFAALPGERELRDEFIALLERNGMIQEAATELDSLLAQAPAEEALWEKSASLKQALGDSAGTDAALTKARELIPRDEPGLLREAALLVRFEKFREAEEVFQQAMDRFGKEGEAAEALAAFYAGRNRNEEAVALWKELAQTADREGLLRISRSLAAHGKAEASYEVLAYRAGEFAQDPLILGPLCQAALAADKAEEAVEQAIALVRNAAGATDLEPALKQAALVMMRSGKAEEYLPRLESSDQLQELCLAAEFLEMQGDSIGSERILNRALAQEGGLVAALQKVRLLELRRDRSHAAQAMGAVVEGAGGMKPVYLKRWIELLEKAGEFDAALEKTEIWLRLAPADKQAAQSRARLLGELGRLEEAVASLRRAAAKAPDDTELASALATALEETGSLAEAWRIRLKLYDDSEDPSAKSSAVQALAVLAQQHGRQQELEELFRARGKENPSALAPLLALRELFRTWDQQKELEEILEELLLRKPGDPELSGQLVDLLKSQGRVEEASPLLTTLSADDPQSKRRVGELWLQQGEAEKAADILAELVAQGTAPRDVEALGLQLAERGEWELLARQFSASAFADDWRLHLLQALALWKNGEEAQAFARLEACFDVENDLPLSTWNLSSHRAGAYFQQSQSFLNADEQLQWFQHMRQTAQQVLSEELVTQYGSGMLLQWLPGTPQQARLQAAACAYEIAVQQDSPQRAALLARIRLPSLPELAHCLALQELDEEQQQAFILSHTEHLPFLRWVVMNQLITPETTDALIERFRDKDPEAELHLLAQNLHGNDQASRILDLLEARDAAALELYTALLCQMFTGSVPAQKGAAPLPEETKRRAEALLLHLTDQRKGPLPVHHPLLSLPVMLDQKGASAKAVEWVNRLAALPVDLSNSYYGVSHSMNRYGQPSGKLPPFAAALQSALPASAYPLLQNHSQSNQTGAPNPNVRKLVDLLAAETSAGSSLPDPPPSSEIRKLAQQIQNPYTRLAYLLRHFSPAELEPEIQSLMEERPEDAAALQLAANWHSHYHQSPAAAYRYLLRASELPMKASDRASLDEALALVGANVAKQAGTDISDEDLEPARRAALRLRKSFAANRQLPKTLNDLGLTEEAARLERSGTVLTRTTGVSRSVRGNVRPEQKIDELLATGKRQEAGRHLFQLRQQLGQMYRDNDHQWLQLIRRYDLIDAVLELSQPAAGATFQRRKDSLQLQYQLRPETLAQEQVDALLEEKPNDPDLLFLASAMRLDQDPEQAIQSLLAHADDLEAIGAMLLPMSFQLQGNTLSAEAILAKFRLTALLLNKLEPNGDPGRNLSWVNYYARQLTQQPQMGQSKLDPLVQLEAGSNTDAELTKQRDEVARSLFLSMLRHPQTARQGFTLIEISRPRLQWSEEELHTAAQATLASQLLETLQASANTKNSQAFSHRSSDPWMYFAKSRGQSQGGMPLSQAPWNALDETQALALLEQAEARYPDHAPLLRSWKQLALSSAAADFAGWSERLPEDGLPRHQQIRGFLFVSSLLRRDQWNEELLSLLCEALARPTQSQFANLLLDSIRDVLSQAAEIHGIPSFEKQFRTVMTSLVGPEEAWPLYAGLFPNYGSSLPYPIYQRVSWMQHLMSSLQSSPKALIAAVRFLPDRGVDDVYFVSPHVVQNAWKPNGDAQTLAESLLDLGIFQPGPGAFVKERNEQMPLMLQIMQSIPEKEFPELGKRLLQTEGPQRFWARLTGARLTQADHAVVLAELKRAWPDIQKWTAPQQAAFAEQLFLWFEGLEQSSSGTHATMIRELRRRTHSTALEQAQAWIRDGFDTNSHPYHLSPQVGKSAAELMRIEPDLAAPLWIAFLQFLQQNSSNLGNSPEDLAAHCNNTLISSFSKPSQVSAATVVDFALQVQDSEVGKQLGPGIFDWGSYAWQQLLAQDASRATQSKQTQQKVSSLDKLIQPFAGHLLQLSAEGGQANRPTLAALFYLSSSRNSWNQAKQQIPLIEAWLKQGFLKQHPAMADSLTLLLAHHNSNEPGESQQAQVRAALLAVLGEESIPAALRLAVFQRALSGNLRRSLNDGEGLASIAQHWASLEGVLARSTASHRHSNQFYSVQHLQIFAGFSELRPETAKYLSESFAEPLAQAQQRFRASGNQYQGTTVLLQLALRSGDAELVQQVTNRHAADIRGSLTVMLQLWQNGFRDAAARLVARPGEFHSNTQQIFLSPESVSSDWPGFSREMEAALPEWLQSIGDPAQRFRIETLLSCRPDVAGDLAASTSRAERLQRLAARFAQEGPASREARIETLAALTVEDATLAALDPEIAPLLQNLTLSQLLPVRNRGGDEANASYTLEALIRRHVQYSLEERGDAAPLLAELRALSLASSANNLQSLAVDSARSLLRTRTYLLFQTFAKEGAPPPSAPPALELAAHLLGFSPSAIHPTGILFAIGAHAEAGTSLEEWLATLPEQSRNAYEETRKKVALQDLFRPLASSSFQDEECEASRRKLLASLLLDPATCNREIQHLTDLSRLIDSGAFTREDLLQAIDALPADHPRKPEFLIEKASILGRNREDAALAQQGYQDAETAALAAGREPLVHVGRTYHAFWLGDRGQTSEAIQLSQTIDLDQLPELEKGSLVKRLKTWQEQGKKTKN